MQEQNSTLLKDGYNRQLESVAQEFSEHDFSNDYKFIYSAVKKLSLEPYVFNPITIENDMECYFAIVDTIGAYTPREFMTIFPIEKEFKGHQVGFKDYYTTMEKINEIGLDNNIENGFDFLWDCCNWDINEFFVNMMMVMNSVRKLQGNGGIIESFMKSQVERN